MVVLAEHSKVAPHVVAIAARVALTFGMHRFLIQRIADECCNGCAPQGVGYGILCGFGAFFAILTVGLVMAVNAFHTSDA